jgi:hypothetical protein
MFPECGEEDGFYEASPIVYSQVSGEYGLLVSFYDN